MRCEWCGNDFIENDRMMALIVSTTSAWVCYECALAHVEEPKLVLDFEPSEQWPQYYSQ